MKRKTKKPLPLLHLSGGWCVFCTIAEIDQVAPWCARYPPGARLRLHRSHASGPTNPPCVMEAKGYNDFGKLWA